MSFHTMRLILFAITFLLPYNSRATFVGLEQELFRGISYFIRSDEHQNTEQQQNIILYPKECFDILELFSLSASNLTLCSILNARPVRLCEKCIDHYVNFHNKYRELQTTVVNGTSCKSIFFSHDRLDVILQYHDSILAVWEKGNCNSCFEWSGSLPVLKNETIHFNKLFNDTINCLVNNYNPEDNSTVCEKCMQFYLQLDSFYLSLSKDAIGVDSVCMDIVDSMNATRSIWSKTLNCCKLRITRELVFLCSAGIISFLPIIFYLSVRFCGPIRDLPKVLKQSRIKQTILRSVHPRED